MLLKYLYNNYRLSRLFLCSVPSSKAFSFETKKEKVKHLLIINQRQILTQPNVEQTQLYYKNMHTSCKPKGFGLPV